MQEAFGDLGVTTPIDNMACRVLIQQRSLWLTAPDVLQFKINRNAGLRAIAQEKEAAAIKKAANKAEQARLLAVRLADRESSTKDGNAHVPSEAAWCGNSACQNMYQSTSTLCRECSLCGDAFVVCGAKKCLTHLNNHQKICGQRREPLV